MIIAVILISRIAQQHFLPLIKIKPQSVLDRCMKQKQKKTTLKPQIRCIRHFEKKSIILNNGTCMFICKTYW